MLQSYLTRWIAEHGSKRPAEVGGYSLEWSLYEFTSSAHKGELKNDREARYMYRLLRIGLQDFWQYLEWLDSEYGSFDNASQRHN
jgi:hypothetical protein